MAEGKLVKVTGIIELLSKLKPTLHRNTDIFYQLQAKVSTYSGVSPAAFLNKRQYCSTCARAYLLDLMRCGYVYGRGVNMCGQ